MADLPSGLLSLTYHLAYDDYYRQLWMSGQFKQCYDAFGITDKAVQQQILAVNNRLGSANAEERNALVDQWMQLVGNDVKSGAANPKILW